MTDIFKDRKFLLAMLDAVVSTVILVIGAFAPQHRDLALAGIAIWNVPLLYLIHLVSKAEIEQMRITAANKAMEFYVAALSVNAQANEKQGT